MDGRHVCAMDTASLGRFSSHCRRRPASLPRQPNTRTIYQDDDRMRTEGEMFGRSIPIAAYAHGHTDGEQSNDRALCPDRGGDA